VKGGFASQHEALYASLPSCPHCSRDLLSSCLHEFFVLFCSCGRRVQSLEFPMKPSTPGLNALLGLLETFEGQFNVIIKQAEEDSARGQDPRSGGLDRILQRLEAQILLLRNLTQLPARTHRRVLTRAS
jgi:hypothetical protein